MGKISEKVAQGIMGNNLVPIEAATSHYKISTNANMRRGLSNNILFSEALLEECKDTHILVPHIPITLSEIREKIGIITTPNGHPGHCEGIFSGKYLYAQWGLFRKTVVPDSVNKPFEDQRLLLTKQEEIPEVSMLAYAVALYYLTSGNRLFSDIRARCTKSGFTTLRPVVGSSDKGVYLLQFAEYWSDKNTGLGSQRKP